MNHSLLAVAAGLIAVTYAWFATGAGAFTAGAYTYVATPSLVALAIFVATERRRSAERSPTSRVARALPWANSAPWIAILAAAVVLEAVGLALGGRSTSVPTLSTTVDHVLVTHVARWLLFVAWLAIIAWGLARQASRAV